MCWGPAVQLSSASHSGADFDWSPACYGGMVAASHHLWITDDAGDRPGGSELPAAFVGEVSSRGPSGLFCQCVFGQDTHSLGGGGFWFPKSTVWVVHRIHQETKFIYMILVGFFSFLQAFVHDHPPCFKLTNQWPCLILKNKWPRWNSQSDL